MAEMVAAEMMVDASGVPLKISLARANRRRRLVAFALVLPLLAFIGVSFIFPMGEMLLRSIDNKVFSETLPQTADALNDWDGQGQPDEALLKVFAAEMAVAQGDKSIGRVANRLNYEVSGGKSLLVGTARKIARISEEPTSYYDLFVSIDKDWADPVIWRALKRIAPAFTLDFYASALDLTYDNNGQLVAAPEEERIYVPLFVRTFWVSLAITAIATLLAYPISYMMAHSKARVANLLMIMVLLPFWTSLLVRTTSWITLLQTNGVLNDLLVALHFVDDENRFQLIFNMFGTIVVMVHILLPFMVLPLYSVMKTISGNYTRAARSLGATPWTAFWRIYFPQTLPGIGAGSILVFILAVGYYITPALVGGRTGQLISNFIAFHMQKSLNWGLAAALGSLLLFSVLLLYFIYSRVVGIDKVKLG